MDYQDARGAFGEGELDAADAANLLQVAYGARCQHSDKELSGDSSTNQAGGWIALLLERREAGLMSS